uniref:Transporter n=1 Tax=Globodera rostochiensis TaxID=31243 RepID=A0A914IAH5_GLORO
MPNTKKTKGNGGGNGGGLLLQPPEDRQLLAHHQQKANGRGGGGTPSPTPSDNDGTIDGGFSTLAPIGQNKLSSRVMFSSDDVMDASEDDGREGWDNKMQFFMGVISYAVGFGNVWRFPFLLQKNGGGAFLIPYLIMMIIEGVPLFLIELGIGQRLRMGSVGPPLWCPTLWRCITIFELPWSSCPTLQDGVTPVMECANSTSPTNYFWNRQAIDTTDSIGDFGGFNWKMTGYLVFSWFLIYLCVMKGIKSSGKVMYVTATFPYVVMTMFLFRSIMLEGATDGLRYMITPNLYRLSEPEVWLEAATQIFYSMGLGFGGLIAFASYNPLKNNVKKDVLKMSVANLLTSLYTAFVIFCVLGYMGRKNFDRCIEKDMSLILKVQPGLFRNMEEVRGNISVDEFTDYMRYDFRETKFSEIVHHPSYQKCELGHIIAQAAEGTGLAFVVFTEAILQFPFPPLWAILFFMMLLMLGLGSMFGMLEGVITSLNDAKMIPLSKPILAAILCTSACMIGLVFTTQAGQYWVSLFDQFAGSYALMCVAFFEIIAVIYVYGCDRFVRDLQYMTNEPVGLYWTITWRFISPVIMVVIFVASVFKSFSDVPKYSAYDSTTTHQHNVPYPTWALFIAFGLVVTSMASVPFIWFVRKFKIWRVEPDIPVASKCLGSTPSTTYMLRSDLSFNQILESRGSELQNIGKGGQRNGTVSGGGGSAPVSAKHHRHHNGTNDPNYNNHHTWHSSNAPPRGWRQQQRKKGSDTDLSPAVTNADSDKMRKQTQTSTGRKKSLAEDGRGEDGLGPRSERQEEKHQKAGLSPEGLPIDQLTPSDRTRERMDKRAR